MAIALYGISALNLYFTQRNLRLGHRAPLPETYRTEKKDLYRISKEEWLEESAEVEILLPLKTRGRHSYSIQRNEFNEDREPLVAHFKSDPSAFCNNEYIRYDYLYIPSPELCFLQLARTLSFLDLLLLGFKMCGDYRPSLERWSTGEQPLTSVSNLQLFLENHPHESGVALAKKVVGYLQDNSNSHMESRLTIVLSLPRKYGGYGLKPPKLNQDIPRTERTGDLCWLNEGLVIEYDSEENHSEEYQKDRDSIRRTEIELSANGMKVIIVRKSQVSEMKYLDQIAQLAARQIKADLRPRSKKYEQNKKQLHKFLFHTANAIDSGKE